MEFIIIIGHGSPKKDANNLELTARLLHNAIHPDCHKECVKVAYLQFSSPDIMETIRECVFNGARRIVLHPYFLSAGVHVTKDIPEIISQAGNIYPGVEFVYTEPLGMHDKLIQVIIERIGVAKITKPAEIETMSFEIISREVDLCDVPAEQLPVIKRVIHATADFEFKKTLMFHPQAIKTGLAAIKAGKDILTDIEMVRTGINKRLLGRWGGKALCNILHTPLKGGEGKGEGGCKTRAELGIELALGENNNIGIVVIGNAPTALFKVMELFNNNPHPQVLVIGVPVGFVNALESKTLLASQNFPFITNLSRKGGTPVAVAIVNALLKMAEGG